jgi:transposase-like protein
MQGLPQWRWHLDGFFVRINGEMHYLWRAVDDEGEVLETCVTTRRDRKAALRFLNKAMKRYASPLGVVTDRLRSYGVGMKELGNQARPLPGIGSTIGRKTHTFRSGGESGISCNCGSLPPDGPTGERSCV